MDNADIYALGLEANTVAIVPYDERWPALFERASAELRAALGASMVEIYHVGSTSVPGLCAKPILDMLVTVPQLSRAALLIPELAALGYKPGEDDIADRLFFQRRRGTARTHHLSLAEPDSHYHTVTLAFRDALRGDPALAARYCELKRALARRFPTDRLAYLDGKTGFVLSALEAYGR
jgi:GrpB-like predicted nucleotidyltransferase (UPF0157 family)